MFKRKTGWRAILAAGVATAVVVSLNPPSAAATTGAPSVIKYRNASDPHVEGCSYIDSAGQHDYLCMYASSDLPVDEHDAPNFNHYPMDSTYVYYYDIAAGGNINPQGTSMFEPIGGSAPKYTGQDVINPLAAICAGQMMLDFLGETAAAKASETAVIKIVREKIKSLAAGKMGYSTTQVGDLVAATL